jgi:hypothetical protein
MIISAYDLPPLPFIYMVRGYRILNPRLIPYYSVINFISLIGSAETHAGALPDPQRLCVCAADSGYRS